VIEVKKMKEEAEEVVRSHFTQTFVYFPGIVGSCKILYEEG
jgi:hypothetical protein